MPATQARGAATSHLHRPSTHRPSAGSAIDAPCGQVDQFRQNVPMWKGFCWSEIKNLVNFELGLLLTGLSHGKSGNGHRAHMGGAKMSDANRLLFLRITLIVIGLTFIFGIYTLGVVWPSGWAWGQGHSHYLMMIIGVYATLGVFLLIASRDPYAHKSIIWFTVWSSVVHGAIMGVQSFTDAAERGHLIGDVPALILVAIILAVLMPRTAQA